MITVVGSLNMDLMVSVDRVPQVGETLFGNDFWTAYGGKGGNQAVAAARLGAEVAFLGAVGQDSHGQAYLDHLDKEGIDHKGVAVLPEVPTGTALITVANHDNSIIVISGANRAFDLSQCPHYKEVIQKSSYLVLQFEVSDQVIAQTLDLAQAYGVQVILNPAPFRPFPLEWLDKVAYFTPNETEYQALLDSGMDLANYEEKIIITQGKQGVSCFLDGQSWNVPAPRVQALDTTGAGDTFNGALACFLEKGYPLKEACQWAVQAASLSTTKRGAQTAMPSLGDLRSAFPSED